MVDLRGQLHAQVLIGRTVLTLQQGIGGGCRFQDVTTPFTIRWSSQLMLPDYKSRFGLNTGKGNTPHVPGILLAVRSLVVRTVEGEDMRND